jgi:peptidoglycan/xylan/chitin deacetylase (PgdA/CDA1 family)
MNAGVDLAAVCGPVAAMAWAVRGRRAITLTFDDGPSEGTPQILEILAEYRVPATFFQCGANVTRLPDVARAVARAGHAVGNHSNTHPLFCFRSRSFLEADLRRAQEAIEEHTGCRPTWFRAPFGVRWFGMAGIQRRLGLTGVMWTVIGYDWSLDAGRVAGRISQHVSNGAILCLHDGRELRVKPDIEVTVEAVRRLVPMLLERGYRFETLNRLLCPTT